VDLSLTTAAARRDLPHTGRGRAINFSVHILADFLDFQGLFDFKGFYYSRSFGGSKFLEVFVFFLPSEFFPYIYY
jgi:hypothetical protein